MADKDLYFEYFTIKQLIEETDRDYFFVAVDVRIFNPETSKTNYIPVEIEVPFEDAVNLEKEYGLSDDGVEDLESDLFEYAEKDKDELLKIAEEAAKWYNTDFDAKEAMKWREAELEPEEAKKWSATKLRPKEIIKWKSIGVENPEEMRKWKNLILKYDLSLREIEEFIKRGLSPFYAERELWEKKRTRRKRTRRTRTIIKGQIENEKTSIKSN